MQQTLRLKIKVVPGASRSGISGWLGDALKVRVSAAPEKGRANDAVLKLLAFELGLPESALAIVAGHTSPLKTVEIQGMAMTGLLEKLGSP